MPDGSVVKVIELVGSSPTSFSDAVRDAVAAAAESVRGIRDVEVISSTAEVEDGRIRAYRVGCRIAFEVERGRAAREDLSRMAAEAAPEPPYIESGGPDLEK